MDNKIAAKIILPLIDLTSLKGNEKSDDIINLCRQAQTEFGNVAAICVYPNKVSLARTELKDSKIKLATVVNFPKGEDDIETITHQITKSIEQGADEIDIVFPYKKFLNGNIEAAYNTIKTAKKTCGKKTTLKVILETGEIRRAMYISEAARLSIQAGADFIKTSTGKTKISATPDAANCIIETIRAMKDNTGFKASGGISTVSDAKDYLILADKIMGSSWITPRTFRFGASSLLDDVLNELKG